jgi:hypothetical protein
MENGAVHKNIITCFQWKFLAKFKFLVAPHSMRGLAFLPKVGEKA